MLKLNAKELRTTEPTPEQIKAVKKNPIYIILDNVLDTYNIGSIFRLADAVGAEKVFLCGQTLTPPNHRIKKASINTWNWVNWEYCETAVSAIKKAKACHSDQAKRVEESSKARLRPRSLDFGTHRTVHPFARDDKLQIIAVEQDKRSVPYTEMKVDSPVAIVVGNETYGVSKEALKMADQIVEIPMFGVNKSLNVMVSLGIILFKIMERKI